MGTDMFPIESIDTDVLVIGGGLAGCLAAIKARDNGAEVTLIEKANINRSGSGGPGLDHLPGIADPRLNGITPEELAAARESGGWGEITNHKLNMVPAKHSVEVIKELERAGVQVAEEDGTYKFAPGRLKADTDGAAGKAKLGDFILYRGADLKLKLAAAVKNAGTNILNRVMVVDLITKGHRVIGAVGVNTRDGSFITIHAGATVICTGGAHRLYQQPHGTFPNNLFLNHYTPLVTGDGTASAYRAGARLVNMEILMIQQMDAGLPPGPRPVLFGKLKNSKGEEILKKHSDLISKLKGESAYRFMMAAAREKGEVLQWDTTALSEEVERYWEFMMSNEDPRSLKFMKARGGLRRNPIQSRTHIWGVRRSVAGVIIDEKGRSSVEGLFIAGDTQGGTVSTGSIGAFAWGYICGIEGAAYAKRSKKEKSDPQQLERIKSELYAPMKRQSGIEPLELENTMRDMLTDYVGLEKHAVKMNRFLEFHERMKKNFVPQLIANDAHELMHTVEIKNMMDVAELHVQASLVRTESRMIPAHYRVDFPDQNDEEWGNKVVVQWKKDNELATGVETPDWVHNW